MSGNVGVMDKAISTYLAEHRHITINDIVVEFKSEGKNLLHIAASSGHEPSLNYFIEKCSASIKGIVDLKDDKGMTAIMNATISENEANMKTLIKAGGNVNLCDI